MNVITVSFSFELSLVVFVIKMLMEGFLFHQNYC